MKRIAFLLFLIHSMLFAQKRDLEKSTIIIPPKQVIVIDYPNYKGFGVKVWNKAKFEVGISSRSKKTDSLQKGFGLNKGASASLLIEEDMYLQFENRFFAPLEVQYTIYKGKPGKKKSGRINPSAWILFGQHNCASNPIKNSWDHES